MRYQIVSYIGDYPLEDQPWWDRKFVSLPEAKACAKAQHLAMQEQRPGDETAIYTVVQNDQDEGDTIHFLIYQDLETGDPLLATRLANELGES